LLCGGGRSCGKELESKRHLKETDRKGCKKKGKEMNHWAVTRTWARGKKKAKKKRSITVSEGKQKKLEME